MNAGKDSGPQFALNQHSLEENLFLILVQDLLVLLLFFQWDFTEKAKASFSRTICVNYFENGD